MKKSESNPIRNRCSVNTPLHRISHVENEQLCWTSHVQTEHLQWTSHAHNEHLMLRIVAVNIPGLEQTSHARGMDSDNEHSLVWHWMSLHCDIWIECEFRLSVSTVTKMIKTVSCPDINQKRKIKTIKLTRQQVYRPTKGQVNRLRWLVNLPMTVIRPEALRRVSILISKEYH